MKNGWARALFLTIAAVAACGKGASSSSTGDAGPHGPTDLVAAWTFTGKPASASECMAHGAVQVYVNLTGTIDPKLHQTMTVDCAKGSVKLGSPLVEDLGQPYLEASLLDADGVTVMDGIAGVLFTPAVGKTTVTLDFFPDTSASSSSSSSSSSSGDTTSSSSTSGGMGGMGGTGGMPTTSSSSTSGSGMGGMGGGSATSSSGAGGAGGAG